MLITEITCGGAAPMLEKTLAFNEARQRMLVENIANVSTPGYRAKQLDVASFEKALKDASARRQGGYGELQIKGSGQFETDEQGMLRVTPGEVPVENLLFADGTNLSIERQMSQLAEVTISQQVNTELLKGYFEGITKAIRGRVV